MDIFEDFLHLELAFKLSKVSAPSFSETKAGKCESFSTTAKAKHFHVNNTLEG